MKQIRPTTATIDLDAVRHNVRRLRELAGGAELCAVVKADAYGHGAVPVARAAVDAGASHLAIATVEEAGNLRLVGLRVPLLLFSEPPLDGVDGILAADITPSVSTIPFAEALAAAGRARGRAVPVHLAFDTGMGRVGVPHQDAAAFLAALPDDGLEVVGQWTHLARADEPGVDTTELQLDAFDDVRAHVAAARHRPALTHAANSAGVLGHPRSHLDMVRTGVAMYGLSPSAEMDAAQHRLRPVLSLSTQVRFVKQLRAGTGVSYGHRWHAPSDGWLATLPLGYADGVPRGLTNRWEVLHDGRRRPVVGTVTMDMVHVWFDDVEPAVGDEVALLGTQGDEQIRVEEWASILDTITYEITCGISARVPRRHVG